MKSNKKRILFVLAILTMALVLSCALVACNKTDSPDAPKKEFTITFDTRGGSEVKPITIAEGATITLPRNPTKEGYIFDGWYLSDEFIEKFNATQTISSNITVYAKWREDGGNQDEKQSYTITFDTQGGNEIKQLVLKEGETLTLPSNPTKEGSVFDGWYLDSSYTQAFDSTKRIDSNIVLYAKWKILDEGQSIIASDYFDINGLVLTMNKKNYIESTEDVFDLRNKFSTSNGSSWRAFTSPNCDQPTEITTRTANVSAGWNNIYVMVENLTTYRNQIYRLKIYKYPTIVYRELDDGFLEIQSVSDCADVLFPDDKIDNITSIGEHAFSSCPSLRTLQNLPKLTNIGTSAFTNCQRLTNIEIPDSVTSIGSGAFKGCSSLESITIPFVGAKAGVTSGDTNQYPFGYIFGTSSYIGSVATEQYYYGDSTSSTTYDTYYIPSSLKSVTVTGGNILYGAFYKCTGLTSITIPDSVTSIGDYAFFGCKGLTSVTIPDSVTSIGYFAFSGCSSLESITIPFVGAKAGVTSSDTYQYPFGYIFGTSSYDGGVATTQYYYGSSTSSTTSDTYYIPSSLKSVTVTGGNILYGAFYGCKGLTSITIPDRVTSIGERAFFNCAGLISVTIGNSVMSIGERAFFNCAGLTSVTIGNSVMSIGNYAFYNCSGLSSITIPNRVTSIGNYAFYNCSGLSSITIPNRVTSIGDSAFRYCYRLVEVYNKSTLSITAGSSSNGYVAYYAKNVYTNEGGSKLTTDENGYVIYTDGDEKILVAYRGINTELILPSDITKINQHAFRGCTGLTSVTIPGSVTSIGNSAFYGCTSLKSVTIPNSVTNIGDSAFSGCSSLTSVIIPDSVTSISAWAFSSCTRLTSVTIGDGVTSIGDDAFDGCYRLVEVYNKSTLSITAGSSSNGYVAYYAKNVYTNEGGSKLTTDENGYVIYTDGDEKILVAYRGINTELVLPSYITKINQNAFRDCSGLTSITIGNSVTSIGESAFEDCSGLTSITIPKSVTSIGNYAFDGCYRLVEVYNKSALSITAGSSSNGYVAYYAKNVYKNEGGSKLTTDENGYVIYTDGDEKILVAYLGTNTELVLPSYITKINQNAFRDCSGLTSITIGNNVTSIGESAFEDCSGLTSIVIPNSVTSIGSHAFAYCSRLTSVTIGNSVTIIGYSAFYGCSGLTSVTIPDSVTSIGNYAFYGCSGLTSVTIPDSVTSIGGSAFRDCNNLQNIYITDIAAWCNISGLSNLMKYGASNKNLYINNELATSITIPNGVTAIPSSAFRGCTGLTSITIPNSVTSIGASAFDDCSGLTSVEIPGSVTSIGSFAFDNCDNLQDIYITDIAAWCNISGLYNLMDDSSSNKKLYINNELVTSVTIPDGVTAIPSYAFYGCSGLASIIIPDSVTSIGNYAFSNCTGLTSITIPNSVTSIGSDAFAYCTGLTSVTIGGSVTSIGESAFDGCTGLTSITFNGTIAQWRAISKGNYWKYKVPSTCIVHCIDGDIKA